MTRIIQEVTARLLSMLDPTGIMAVVNSFIAFFRVVQSFIEKLREILELLNSFVLGVSEIARGNISQAANFLEDALARGLSIAIAFLANQVGLRGLGRRVSEMIGRAREMINRGIDWLIDRAIRAGSALLNLGRRAVAAIRNWWQNRKQFEAEGESHALYFTGSERSARLMLSSNPVPIETWLRDKRQELEGRGEFNGAKRNAHTVIQGLISEIGQFTESSGTGGAGTGPRPIDVLMNELAVHVQVLGPDIKPPVPNMYVNPGFSSAKARNTEAKFIFDGEGNHADGSEPSSSTLTPEMDAIRGMGLGGGRWVQFHLINRELGGRGVNSNLVPLPVEYNNQFRADFEDPLKNIYGGSAQEGTKYPVWYSITLIYWRSNTLWLRSINVRGGKMRPSGNTWINGRGLSPWSRTNIEKPSVPTTGVSMNEFITQKTAADIPDYMRSTSLYQKTLQMLLGSGAISDIDDIETRINNQTGSLWTPERKENHIRQFRASRDAGRIRL